MGDDAAFLVRLAEILEIDAGQLGEMAPLPPAAWDSVSQLGAIALIDEVFGVTVPTNELRACRSVGELLELVHRQTP